jgi:Holliday junction resolvase-like predicted endonuclease
MQVKVKALSRAELAEKLNRRKSEQSEIAARLYLGKKQIERELRIDRVFMTIWACLVIAALAAPFILFAGV